MASRDRGRMTFLEPRWPGVQLPTSLRPASASPPAAQQPWASRLHPPRNRRGQANGLPLPRAVPGQAWVSPCSGANIFGAEVKKKGARSLRGEACLSLSVTPPSFHSFQKNFLQKLARQRLKREERCTRSGPTTPGAPSPPATFPDPQAKVSPGSTGGLCCRPTS